MDSTLRSPEWTPHYVVGSRLSDEQPKHTDLLLTPATPLRHSDGLRHLRVRTKEFDDVRKLATAAVYKPYNPRIHDQHGDNPLETTVRVSTYSNAMRTRRVRRWLGGTMARNNARLTNGGIRASNSGSTQRHLEVISDYDMATFSTPATLGVLAIKFGRVAQYKEIFGISA